MTRRAHGYLVLGLLGSTVAASLVMRFVFPPNKDVLSLELPRSVDELEAAVGSTPAERERNRRNTYADFAFLTSYTALFAAAGSLLARQGRRSTRALGLLAVATGVATGVLDVLEDMTILRGLQPSADPHEFYSRVRHISIPKWILAVVTNFALVPLVAFGRWWTRVLGPFAALIGIRSLLTLKRI